MRKIACNSFSEERPKAFPFKRVFLHVYRERRLDRRLATILTDFAMSNKRQVKINDKKPM